MRNQRALAAACAAVAALGLAAPVAVADGMGNGGGPSNSNSLTAPDNGNFNAPGNGNGNNQGNWNNGNWNNNNGNNSGNNNGNWNNGNNGNGNWHNNGNGGNDGNGNGNQGNNPGNNQGGNNGNNQGNDNDGGRGDGNPRNIVATPSVLAAGSRLTVTVEGCRGGTMSSRAFRTTRLTQYRGDSARGVATVDRDARPGRYDITVNCDGRTLTRPSAFTVLGGVQGGVGGSQSHGATATDMAIGGGLVGAAVIGGGIFWLRRRHEKRI